VPEIIDPVFTKTRQNARFLLSENEPFGLVFVKTGSINSGTDEGKRQEYDAMLWIRIPIHFERLDPVLHWECVAYSGTQRSVLLLTIWNWKGGGRAGAVIL
jgi:hypothetical protein